MNHLCAVPSASRVPAIGALLACSGQRMAVASRLTTPRAAVAYGFLWPGLARVTCQDSVPDWETGCAAVNFLIELVAAVVSSVGRGEADRIMCRFVGALLMGTAAWLGAGESATPVATPHSGDLR